MNTESIRTIDRALRSRQEITLLGKLTVYQEMSRVWRRYLNPHEIVAMSYIIDRSVGWGKNHFTAAHANILDGNEEYAGIGLKQRTYFRTLKSLEEKGLIRRRNRRDCVTMVVNVNWQPEELQLTSGEDISVSRNVFRFHSRVH